MGSREAHRAIRGGSSSRRAEVDVFRTISTWHYYKDLPIIFSKALLTSIACPGSLQLITFDAGLSRGREIRFLAKVVQVVGLLK